MPQSEAWKKRAEQRLRQRNLRLEMENARLRGDEDELARLLGEYRALLEETSCGVAWSSLSDERKYERIQAGLE